MDADDDEGDMDLVMVGAALLVAGQGSGAWFSRDRREVERCQGGALASTMAGYLVGDDVTYIRNFRMSRDQLWDASRALAHQGYLKDNVCQSVRHRFPGRFKFACCMYVLAHGANGTSQWKGAADCAGLGESTVEGYMSEFNIGVVRVLGPDYLPGSDCPPPPERLARIREEFAKRRGIPNVALAVDGTHIPFSPPDGAQKDLWRNYKGWHSIHLLLYVNSFHLISFFTVGGTGRTSDNFALDQCPLMRRLKDPQWRKRWLGEDGLIAGDGGTSDDEGLILVPVPMAQEMKDVWYNFCHSSTRFFVEEVNGRLKSRFRIFLTEMKVQFSVATQIIAAAVVLHNYLTLTSGEATDEMFAGGRDEGWDLHFSQFAAMQCPSCRRARALHCVHLERNALARPMKVSSCGKENRCAMRDLVWSQVDSMGAHGEVQEEMAASRSRRDQRRQQRADGRSQPIFPEASDPQDGRDK